MSPQLVIRPEAELELQDAYDWYQQQSPGLGDEFLRCIDAAFNNIVRHPHVGPIVHRDIRRVLIRRFPYAIFYLIEDADLVVLAVFHVHRDPEEWHERK